MVTRPITDRNLQDENETSLARDTHSPCLQTCTNTRAHRLREGHMWNRTPQTSQKTGH